MYIYYVDILCIYFTCITPEMYKINEIENNCNGTLLNRSATIYIYIYILLGLIS